MEFAVEFLDVLDRGEPRDRLDPSHPRRDGRLGDDLEEADVSRPRDVGAAAELGADIAHPDKSDLVGVFFVEDGLGAGLEGLFFGHDTRFHGNVGLDVFVHEHLDPVELGLFYLGKMGEIETKTVGRHERTGLFDVIAQDVAQCGVEEVRARMVGLDGPSRFHLHLKTHRVVSADPALPDLTDVGDEVFVGPLGIPDLKQEVVALDDAGVSDLAARLPVEWRLVG